MAFNVKRSKPARSATPATIVAEAFVGRRRVKTRIRTTPEQAAANGWKVLGTFAEVANRKRQRSTPSAPAADHAAEEAPPATEATEKKPARAKTTRKRKG